ncbi:hypothetical protein [Paenibacillus oleatilyticus]|uniref:hypothetical protein n=1 Tax=Paenibacillus oleatilyticus TaxID=2594886 RepID=UPI001C1F3E42|nr:hypothetical protein [Paenibacillus oleatilyticus]MBU7316421.1 hypothetical protein [Paenibacillus oleatilyticus]
MQDQPKGPHYHREDREDEFLRERMERWGQSQKPPFDPFFRPKPHKSKWLAGLLSFFIPGTGQLYLGLMQRGLGIMLLFIMNIVAIVYFATGGSENIPLIVLFSLLMPVTYFYNIFDALQQTDRVNGYGHPAYFDEPRTEGDLPFTSEKPTRKLRQGNIFGYALIAAGALLFLAGGKPQWLERIFDFVGSSFGAVILIAIGVFMFYKESRKK